MDNFYTHILFRQIHCLKKIILTTFIYSQLLHVDVERLIFINFSKILSFLHKISKKLSMLLHYQHINNNLIYLISGENCLVGRRLYCHLDVQRKITKTLAKEQNCVRFRIEIDRIRIEIDRILPKRKNCNRITVYLFQMEFFLHA